MNSLQSMYNEYVKRYSISKEVEQAFIDRFEDPGKIQRAKLSADKYEALTVLVYNLQKYNASI